MGTGLTEKFRKITLLLSDVDGVLTDGGGIIIDDNGVEAERFNVKDKHDIKLLQRAGIKIVLLTGRTSKVISHRAAELNITNFENLKPLESSNGKISNIKRSKYI
jgi:3-deoxy-D-manno-octulosonate 8-phosphate phosphatase (KDO 8-P phosphatase)